MNQGSLKSGPLTQAELLLIWSTVAVDERSYADPLIALGEGRGLEVYTQMLAQLARASQAIDRTIQSCYILPHSSQSDASAGGAQNATVTLTFTRPAAQRPLVLGAGVVWIDEVQNDSGTDGPEAVATGRRYTPAHSIVFHPGEVGPITGSAIAERPGYGYNNPRPGTLTAFESPGAVLNNVGANLVVTASSLTLTLQIVPDVLTPDQIGEYVEFTSGANLGRYARVISYRAPIVNVDGGQVILARDYSAQSTAFAGAFAEGEAIRCMNGANVVGVGTVLGGRLGADNIYRVTYVLQSGSPAPYGGSIVSVSTGTTMSVTLVSFNEAWASDGNVSWQVMAFDTDLGALVTNVASPSGGRTAMLDLLGSERNVLRASYEGDDSYRQRVAQVADVVSPNAILRGANQVLTPFGIGAMLREVGLPSLPGVFFDAGAGSDPVQVAAHNFAYDMDPTQYEPDQWKVWMSYPEMRGFFLVGVPRICAGDFGLFYDGVIGDANPRMNAYDAVPANACNFVDGGYSTVAAKTYGTLWNEVDARRAGGVSFDLYELQPDGT